MDTRNDQVILNHYRSQAEKYGSNPSSTMPDQIVRDRELALIRAFFEVLEQKFGTSTLKVLDIGSGNGSSLANIAKQHSRWRFTGIDFSPDMLDVAQKYNTSSNCVFQKGDARDLTWDDESFEVVMTKRCLINILDWQGQQLALQEIRRVLRPHGHYLMIESFDDGLKNNNRGRQELGIEPLAEAYHNKYLKKEVFLDFLSGRFKILDPSEWAGADKGQDLVYNFLSSHYFVSRVVLPALTKREIVWNTEFVKFFSFLPPIGNYSCIQAYLLQKE